MGNLATNLMPYVLGQHHDGNLVLRSLLDTERWTLTRWSSGRCSGAPLKSTHLDTDGVGAVQRRVQGRSRRKLHPVFSKKVSGFSSVSGERAEVHSRQERRHGWAACSSDQGDQQAEEGPQLDWQTFFNFHPLLNVHCFSCI